MSGGAEAATSALSTLLADVTTVFTSATGWIGKVVGVIMDTPILLVPFALALGFTAIRMFKSLRS